MLNMKNRTKMVIRKETIRALLKRLIVLREEMAKIFSVKNSEYIPNAYIPVRISFVKNLDGTSE